MLINHLDGGLTLRKKGSLGNIVLGTLGKYRGDPFDEVEFCFERTTSPRIVDKAGREIPLPVLCAATLRQPETLLIADESSASPKHKLLGAIAAAPDAAQRDWAKIVGCSQPMVAKYLKKLADEGLVGSVKGAWKLTKKGLEEAKL